MSGQTAIGAVEVLQVNLCGLDALALAFVVGRNVCLHEAADGGPRWAHWCRKIVVSAARGGHGGVADQDDQVGLVVEALQAQERIG